jgi:hypothetical protein
MAGSRELSLLESVQPGSGGHTVTCSIGSAVPSLGLSQQNSKENQEQIMYDFIRTAAVWNVTQRRFGVAYRRFKTTCRSHLHGSSCSGSVLDLKRGTIDCSKTSVINTQSMLCNIPEERKSQEYTTQKMKRKEDLHGRKYILPAQCWDLHLLTYLWLIHWSSEDSVDARMLDVKIINN